jgi:hypothetical protein
MTDSCCWIDVRGNEELTAQLRATFPQKDDSDPARIDLGCRRYLWINDLREWAARKGLPIEYPGLGWIVEQVTVSKSQLLEFLEDMFGPVQTGAEQPRIDRIRELIREYGHDFCRYYILADEY